VCGKVFLLALVLLFLVFSVSFSDENQDPATMTEQEILTELIALNNQRTLELDQREIALNKKEIRLNERESRMVELGIFSQSLRKEEKTNQWIHDLKMFGIGFLSGNLTGIPAGITIGLKF
jgi:hypothetical protein